jgi:hypothetical protein
MFDFPNNDSHIVIIIDIDNKNSVTLNNIEDIENKINNINKDIFNNIYLIKKGNICKNIIYNYKLKYKNTINVYVVATSIVNIKKINGKVIINFLNKVKNTDKLYSYYKIVKYDQKAYNIKMEQTKPFIYGIDEYFINNTLTKYLIKKKLLLVNKITWDIFGNFYYLIIMRYSSLTESNIRILKKIFGFILNKIGYKFETTSTVVELFNIIDKLIYINKNKEVINILYKLYLKNYNNKKFKFIYPDDLTKFISQPEYKGVYHFEKIILINSEYKEINVNVNRIN